MPDFRREPSFPAVRIDRTSLGRTTRRAFRVVREIKRFSLLGTILGRNQGEGKLKLARLARLERATYGLEEEATLE